MVQITGRCLPSDVNMERDMVEVEFQPEWFTVKSNMGETKQEQDEKKIALQQQYQWGIINEKGIPVGFIEAEKKNAEKEAKKGNKKSSGGKLARKAKREFQKEAKKKASIDNKKLKETVSKPINFDNPIVKSLIGK